MNNEKVHLLIIILLTLLAYSNIFKNSFVVDDKTFIISWGENKSLNNLGKFFSGDLPNGHQGVYRPVRSLLYALDFKVFGENPFGYHLQSILLHIIGAILIYLIVLRISKHKELAFLSALFFGLHPIHTETITYITSSMDVLGIIFFFLSFYLYIHGKNLASVVFALISFFSNEITLTLPFLIIYYDFCFHKLSHKNFPVKAKIYMPYILSVLGYIFIRFVILNISSRGPYLADSKYLTFLTMIKVIVKYLWLTIFPLNQANNQTISKGIEAFVYRGYNQEAIKAQSVFNIDIVIYLLIIIALLILVIKAWKKYPVISFCIGWFFISLLPVLEIIPQGSMFNERFLYIPSFGFVFLLSSFFSLSGSNIQIGKYLKIMMILLIVFSYFTLTYLRNQDWQDNISLWSKDIKVYPKDNAYAYFQLGNAYLEQNQVDSAIKAYKSSFAINPHFAVAIASVGKSYEFIGKRDLARKYYQQSVRIDPNFYNDLLVKYSGNQLSFNYPVYWNLDDKGSEINLHDDSSNFKVRINIISDPPKDYIKKSASIGTLLNQGLARIANVDSAYVKVWKKDNMEKLEFFLFKDTKLVKILVFPATSADMKVFDQLLGSIKIK